ncbi:MAG: helix-turn-helix transcriptional regulator [Pseudonocardiaceae bacterium]
MITDQLRSCNAANPLPLVFVPCRLSEVPRHLESIVTERETRAGDESVPAAVRLAREIRRRRKAVNMSQPELANQIGYTRQYVSLAERPGKNLPSQELVRAGWCTRGSGFAVEDSGRSQGRAAGPASRLLGWQYTGGSPRSQLDHQCT